MKSTLSTLFALLILCIPAFTFSQANKVKVKREVKSKQDQKEAVYTAENTTYARQSIIMELNGGSYKRADSPLPVTRTISPGNSRLLTLNEVNGAPGFNYYYLSGCLNTKPKDVTYLLPILAGKSTRIDTLSNLNAKYFGKAPPKNWVSYSLSAVVGDTVCVSRRGRVISIKTLEGESFEAGVSFSTFRTYVEIEHADCTRGRYDLLDKDHILVKEGQRVEAGMPLGRVADGKKYLNGTHFRFSIYFPIITRDILRQALAKRQYQYPLQYITPNFHDTGAPIPGESLESQHPEDVIFQEMSKREIKRYRKLRGK